MGFGDSFAEIPCTCKVGGNDSIPSFFSNMLGRRHELTPTVIDQDIDGTKVLHDGVGNTFDVLSISDVAYHGSDGITG